MDPAALDHLSRLFSPARSRRALGSTVAGIIAGFLSLSAAGAAACPKGKKRCKGKCIRRRHCCQDGNCLPGVTGKVCRRGRCVCPRSRSKLCNDRCIPAHHCCRDPECGVHQVCRAGVCCTATAEALQAALAPSGPATIQLCPNTAYAGPFVIAHNVSVRGAGRTSSSLVGRGSGPVVTVTAAVTQALLRGLGITCGRGSEGGGIHNSGTLTLVDTVLLLNEADAALGVGGGIHNSGHLTMIDSALFGNAATLEGGGIYNLGVATLTGCGLLRNQAERGGGIFTASSGQLSLVDCDLIASTSTVGSGLYSVESVVTLDHSRFVRNVASGQGGGIYAQSSQLTLQNGTIIGGTSENANRAVTGAGISTSGAGSTMTLDGSHVFGNIATGESGEVVGGIQLDSGAPRPTFQNGSSIATNVPCDCNFADAACADPTCTV